MSPITHFLMGWAVANSSPTLPKRDRALVTWASVVPDVDGLGLVADLLTRHTAHPLSWWGDYHHVVGHNLGFAVGVGVLAALLAKDKRKTILLVLLSFHLHWSRTSWAHAVRTAISGRFLICYRSPTDGNGLGRANGP